MYCWCVYVNLWLFNEDYYILYCWEYCYVLLNYVVCVGINKINLSLVICYI